MAQVNPLRYRGYYYDTDTGLYYLQSRYYDPELGRFINADDPGLIQSLSQSTVMGTHLFVYCNSNPVNTVDIDGNVAANVVGAVIGAIIGAVGGAFLGNWLAGKLGLKGWKKWVFVGAVTVLVGATAAAIGYFIGPYVAKIAVKLGQYVASLIKKGKIVFKKLSSKAKSSVKTLIKETCCFVAGTAISTPKGERPIEEIKIGDEVYASNPESGQIGIKKVVNVFQKQTNVLRHIITETEEIITTEEHPFWVENKGWSEAENLMPGDLLRLQNGETTRVIETFDEHLSTLITVYNFEVEDWHTYFIGSEKVLVHNKCSLTKIKDSFLKQKGLNAHTIKKEVLGAKAKISNYDLFYDKATGAIFVLKKGAKAAAKIATGYFIK